MPIVNDDNHESVMPVLKCSLKEHKCHL